MADNTATVIIAGKEYEVAATLRAGIIYANEFTGKVKEPYLGNILDDVLRLYLEAESTDAGDIRGVNYERLLGIAWACAQAAGSTTQDWDSFLESAMNEDMNVYDMGEIYKVIVHELGDKTFFRQRAGQGDVDAPDNVQADEETS